MIAAEQAQQELSQWLVSKTERLEVVAAIKALPEPVREFGLRITGNHADSENELSNTDKLKDLAKELDGKGRIAFFQILFPNVYQEVEATWQRLGSGPYRKVAFACPFRTPGSPENAIHIQIQWLQIFFQAVEPYARKSVTPEWLSVWAPWLEDDELSSIFGLLGISIGGLRRQDAIGKLLATIGAGKTESADNVLDTLQLALQGKHPVSGFGGHVSYGLILGSAAAFESVLDFMTETSDVELRKVILRACHEASPDRLSKILDRVANQEMFTNDVVQGIVFGWLGANTEVIESDEQKAELLSLTSQCLVDDSRRELALKSAEPMEVFLALWAQAVCDADRAIELGEEIFDNADDTHHQFAVIRILSALQLDRTASVWEKVLSHSDHELSKQSVSWQWQNRVPVQRFENGADIFTKLSQRLEELDALPNQDQEELASPNSVEDFREKLSDLMMNFSGNQPLFELIEIAHKSGHEGSRPFLLRLESATPTREELDFFIQRREDKKQVWGAELDFILRGDLQWADLDRIIRTKPHAKKYRILLHLDDQRLKSIIESALTARKLELRVFGLEMMALLVDENRLKSWIPERVLQFVEERPKLNFREKGLAEILAKQTDTEPSPVNKDFNLSDLPRLVVTEPEATVESLVSDAALWLYTALHEFVEENRDFQYVAAETKWNKDQDRNCKLGDRGGKFPFPNVPAETGELKWEEFPMKDKFDDWFENRPDETKDADGNEMLRLVYWFGLWNGYLEKWVEDGARPNFAKFIGAEHYRPRDEHRTVARKTIEWYAFRDITPEGITFLYQLYESTLANLPKSDLEDVRKLKPENRDFRSFGFLENACNTVGRFRNLLGDAIGIEPYQTDARLARWLEQLSANKQHVKTLKFKEAYELYLKGAIEIGDLADLAKEGSALTMATRQRLESRNKSSSPREEQWHSVLEKYIGNIVEQLLDKKPALSQIDYITGNVAAFHSMDHWFNLLDATNGKKLALPNPKKKTKVEIILRLLGKCWPNPDDSVDEFCRRATELTKKKYSTEDFIKLAILAPQWLEHIEQFLKLPKLREVVYWFLAHGTGRSKCSANAGIFAGYPSVEKGLNDEYWNDRPWTRLIQDRTQQFDLSCSYCIETFEKSWFDDAFPAAGEELWNRVDAADRALDDCDQAHIVSQIYRGQLDHAKFLKRFEEPGHIEQLELVGLLILEPGKKRLDDLVNRVRLICGTMDQATSKAKQGTYQHFIDKALKALARNAGYSSPDRLKWLAADEQLSKLDEIGRVEIGDLCIQIRIEETGEPKLDIQRGEKTLKSVPAAAKKKKGVVQQRELLKELKDQFKSTVSALQEMMIRGETHSATEIAALSKNRLIQPLHCSLVFWNGKQSGRLNETHDALIDCQGKTIKIKTDDVISIAHPIDLYAEDTLAAWQNEFKDAKRKQPFKQLKREICIATDHEEDEKLNSKRFEDRYFRAGQCFRILESYGWETHAKGYVSKGFKYGNDWVFVNLDTDLVDSDDEHDVAVISEYCFSRRVDRKVETMPLAEVPKVCFSEASRELHLSIEKTAREIEESAIDEQAWLACRQVVNQLLEESPKTFSFDGTGLTAKGKLGTYTVDLVTGVNTRKMKGGEMDRRIYFDHAEVPFDHPAVAQLKENHEEFARQIAIAILLSNDSGISQPIIMDQLR